MNLEELKLLETSILDYTVCNICFEFIGSTIFQCNSGHQVCSKCIRKSDNCAFCKSVLPKNGVRARSLEHILELIPRIPCIQEGCDVSLPLKELDIHYQTCKHRFVTCPLHNCSWTGKVSEVDSHFNQQHFDEIIDIPKWDINIHLGNPGGRPTDVYAEIILRTPSNKLFVIDFRVPRDMQSLVGTIVYLGIDNKGLIGTMSLEIEKQSVKLTYDKKPWTLVNPMSEIASSPYNFTIDWEFALRNGQCEPMFRDYDHFHRNPIPSSLNLLFNIKIEDSTICEEPIQDMEHIDNIPINLTTIS